MNSAVSKHGFFCRDVSIAHEEGLIGTAGPKPVRILIQDHSPWTRQGFENCALPEATKTYVKGLFGDEKKPAIMLVRNNNQRQLRKKSIFVVHSSASAPSVYHYYWESPADLHKLPLADALAQRVPANFHQPLYLVCTNGKRDKCCAKYGMPLYKQLKLSLGDKVWRSTHLGGDRFAANMLCLPHGVLYGRMNEHDANKAVHYYEQGKISMQGLRGRTCYPKPVQVAEAYVREQTQNVSLGGLQLQQVEPRADTYHIRFSDKQSGTNYDLIVQAASPSKPRKLSCAADFMESVPSYQVMEFSSSRIYL